MNVYNLIVLYPEPWAPDETPIAENAVFHTLEGAKRFAEGCIDDFDEWEETAPGLHWVALSKSGMLAEITLEEVLP